ncbi:hypothetical protein [Methanobacterium sp.]|uniref:hypothetical protein n=1 Tax=Methanobacterium sp. TaxID=2164 RepID=UPI002ABCFAA0|nr:hypothetical protein [Methanobacterium sp.]MDY9922806.1 hypothetical protein [Methanobacterium sp.]
MIKRETVLVLGAGASNPYNYPLGEGLIQEIYHETINDTGTLHQVLRSLNFTKEEIINFSNALIKSQKPSIDAFLEWREDLRRIGKIAIAYTLIKREKDSLKEFINFNNNDNWYKHFYQSLNTNFEDFDQNKFNVITFNYDRSFEQFLLDALRNSYNKTIDETASKMKKIKIIHLYGNLDDLPWEKWKNGKKRSYGDIPNGDELIETSRGIKIIHDPKELRTFQEARKMLDNAERIVFIGLNLLNEENLNRLNINSYTDHVGGTDRNTKTYGSSYGMTELEMIKVSKYFGGGRIHLGDQNDKSYQFLREMINFID